MPVLHSITIYPLKATRGVALDEAVVERRGLAHDRRWMLVDEAGALLSQRDAPRLALIRTEAGPSRLDAQAPGMEPLSVAVPTASARVPTQIWRDTVAACLAPEAAHAWFSRFLGCSARLVYMDDATVRPVDPQYAVGDDRVSFADGYPVLLASLASLDALNARLDDALPMNRFRPNLVVSGTEPFVEDRWRMVRVGGVRFHVVKPCARCVVTTIDQQTATPGKEPLRTLATFRRRDGEVYFGQNLIPDGPGTVRLGDAVEVLAWKDDE